jgi:septum formation inhibitor-activating ATPase MinD
METSVENPGNDRSGRLEPKGWVGKSTVRALLGMALRDMGKKLGLLDVDLSGRS